MAEADRRKFDPPVEVETRPNRHLTYRPTATFVTIAAASLSAKPAPGCRGAARENPANHVQAARRLRRGQLVVFPMTGRTFSGRGHQTTKESRFFVHPRTRSRPALFVSYCRGLLCERGT